MTKKKEEEKKVYNFGEKETEFLHGKKLPVTYKSPKYEEAKKKAISLIEGDYKEVLTESDFWILVNSYKNKTEAMYSGLIISHNGCLKINEKIENKFDPSCVTIKEDGFKNSLVFIYNSKEQGLFEVGEVSDANLKSEYPYAMGNKRLFDRVVLKLSKIAFSCIYSDSEIPNPEPEDDGDKVGLSKLQTQIKNDFEKLVQKYQTKDKVYAALGLTREEFMKDYDNKDKWPTLLEQIKGLLGDGDSNAE